MRVINFFRKIFLKFLKRINYGLILWLYKYSIGFMYFVGSMFIKGIEL